MLAGKSQLPMRVLCCDWPGIPVNTPLCQYRPPEVGRLGTPFGVSGLMVCARLVLSAGMIRGRALLVVQNRMRTLRVLKQSRRCR